MKNISSFIIAATLLAVWLPFAYDLTDLPVYDLLSTEASKPVEKSVKKSKTYLSKSPLRVRREGMAALLAPAITATKTYTITNDTGLTGASANDELEYIIIITNSGDTDATGVSFTDQIDANTTLVNGSLKVSPIARNDSYTTIGNVGIAIPAESGVLTNDINPGSGSLAITTASPITTTGNGQVTLNTTTGAFTYEPAAGYTGNDTFTYTLDNGSGLTATATVTIVVSGKIWFVNNAAGSNGTGTLASPFQQMSDFGTANTGAAGKPADNDFIFIYTGSGNYTGSATLRNGQKLIGQGASASLLAITGYAAPSGTSAIPATGGTNPVLTTTAASTNALNLGSGNTLRGFTIGNTTGSKIAGTGFGTLTATEVTLNGNGQALNLTTGALAATFTSISSTNSAASGISLSSVTGNLTSTGGTTITNPAAQGIVVNTASAGTFNFGTTPLTGSGGTGLSSTGFANTLQFSSLTITPDAGQKGIDITGATGTLTIPTGSITTSNNSALSIAGVSSASRVTLGVALPSVTVNGSPTHGISLTNTSGTFQIPGSGSTDGSGGTIQNIIQRGAEFINATGITLKNINFINANTTNGTINDADYSTANAAIYLNEVNTVNLTNVDVSGTTVQRGLNGKAVQNLTMSNCDFINCGDAVREGCMALQDLSGTCSITNSTFKKSNDNAVQIYNTSKILGLTISGSTIDETTFGIGLLVDSWGSSNTKITITNSTFTKIPSDAIKTINNDNSIGNYDVSGCTVDPTNAATSPNDIGVVMEVASNETSTVYINIHDNPTLKGKGGSLINLAPAEQSTMHGKVNSNVLTYLPESTPTTGKGIDVFGQDDAQGRFLITNNQINNIPLSTGIDVFNRRGTNGRVDATITGNTINMPQAVTANGYNIRLEAGNLSTSTNNIVCGNVANNTIPAGGKGNNGHFRVSSFGTGSIRLQGSGANATNVWDNNGNNPTSAGGAVISTRTGTSVTTGQTCLVPDNAPSGGRMMADAEIEQNQAPDGESVIPVLADSDNSTLLPATPAELVTPVVEEEKPVAEPAPLPIAEKTVTTATRNKAAREAAIQAGETVTVNGSGSGFTLPAATSVTIKFRVTINSNIPNGTCQVSNQGTVSAAGLTNVLTDDPAVGGSADPTVTPLKSAPVITTAQTAINAAADPTTCTASSSFAVAVAGCPTPTVTYKIGATPITSPHAFPVGVTTVDVTVSNGNAPDATSSFTVTVSPVPAPVIEAAGQPQNQTITVGGNASFTVVAQGTGLTYQWQKKVGVGAFTDIPAAGNASATTATLNLTAVPVSESGTQYRVVVSNQCGSSTTSESATLTVNQGEDTFPLIFSNSSTYVQGNERDVVITISNIGNAPISGPVVFEISKILPAFTITIDPNATTAEVTGHTTVSNGDWTFTGQASRYLITLKDGLSIPANGNRKIVIRVSATGSTKAQAIITARVFTNTGEESPNSNNIVTYLISID